MARIRSSLLPLARTGLFACLAVLITLPLAILAARFRYTSPPSSSWASMRTHILLNSVTAFLIVICFATGMASVLIVAPDAQLVGDEADLHHTLGFALLFLVAAQLALGFVARWWKGSKSNGGEEKETAADDTGSLDKENGKALSADERTAVSSRATPPRKTPLRWLHILFGIVTIALLYVQTWNGLHTEWGDMSDDKKPTPEAVQVVFWVFFLVPVGVYAVSLGAEGLRWLERVGGDEEEEAEVGEGEKVGGDATNNVTLQVAK